MREYSVSRIGDGAFLGIGIPGRCVSDESAIIDRPGVDRRSRGGDGSRQCGMRQERNGSASVNVDPDVTGLVGRHGSGGDGVGDYRAVGGAGGYCNPTDGVNLGSRLEAVRVEVGGTEAFQVSGVILAVKGSSSGFGR